MTVRYLRSVRNQNMTGRQNEESLIIEYQQCVRVFIACFRFCTMLNDSIATRAQLVVRRLYF